MQQYEGIVEIEACGAPFTVNFYLRHGYRLMEIGYETREAERKDGQYYTKRQMIYVMGRTTDVARVERPKRPKREEEPADGPGVPDRPAVDTTEGESQDPG